MKKIHPCYLQKAVETEEFEENLLAGLKYWTSLINGSIDGFPESEVPLIIAALAGITREYERNFPEALAAVQAINDNMQVCATKVDE